MEDASAVRKTYHGQTAVLDLIDSVLGGVQANRVEGEGVDEAGLRWRTFSNG